MASPQIVRAGPSDAGRLTPLFNAFRVFYGQRSDPSRSRRFVADRLTERDSVVFMAMASDRAVGFAQLYPSFSSVAMRRIWILNDLFVRPTDRRLGVGRALVERARAHAAETGAQRLVLETRRDNPARVLYERLGFRREQSFLHYELDLAPAPAAAAPRNRLGQAGPLVPRSGAGPFHARRMGPAQR